MRGIIKSLTPSGISQILRRDEFAAATNLLPSFAKSIECNQLASNTPIEDRIRISSTHIPGHREPTLFLGVFDGHGGSTTVDIISRRLFDYISLSLHPERNELTDIHHCPLPKHDPSLRPDELENLSAFREWLLKRKSRLNEDHKHGHGLEQEVPDENSDNNEVVEGIKASFRQCDNDLSDEIQRELIKTKPSHAALHYYLTAAVSGCCSIVMVLHDRKAYVASSGDCRAVLGIINPNQTQEQMQTIELLEEHNCYSRAESRRLASSHPPSEQNTIVKNNRLLGHLMPFRAFGDFNYKWPAETIRQCGLTHAFGPHIIPANYDTPPYLIAEPDVKQLDLENLQGNNRFVVLATDGLWELFESSRDVISAVGTHWCLKNSGQFHDKNDELSGKFDDNCATYLLRQSLSFGSMLLGSDSPPDKLDQVERMQHDKLEAMLTLPKSISRNFRDDISVIVLKLDN